MCCGIERGKDGLNVYLCGESQIEDVLIVADWQFIILCDATHGMQRILRPHISSQFWIRIHSHYCTAWVPYPGIGTC